MTKSRGRLLAGVLVPLAIGGTLAGCGDENPNPGSAATTGNAAGPSTSRPAASAEEVDKAFVRQMVPHHKMAVDMAETAEERAEHEEIKTLASEIISAQNKEIAELRATARELSVVPDEPMSHGAGSPTHGTMADDAETLGLAMAEMGMSMDMDALEDADPFDKAFIDEMTVHHKGAIAMARAQLTGGQNADLRTIATAIVSAQQKEIAEMTAWKTKWYSGGSDQEAEAVGSDEMPGMGH